MRQRVAILHHRVIIHGPPLTHCALHNVLAALCHNLSLQDDIERLLEYVAIGPRFSNVVLQVGRWEEQALSAAAHPNLKHAPEARQTLYSKESCIRSAVIIDGHGVAAENDTHKQQSSSRCQLVLKSTRRPPWTDGDVC